MVRGSRVPLARAFLAVALVAALTLAGCSSKKDKDDPVATVGVDTAPLGTGPMGALPIAPAPPPKDCRGCIDLSPTATDPSPVQEPPASPVPSVTIPFPAIGDVVMVHGTSWADPELTEGLPMPLETDGGFFFELSVAAVTTRVPEAPGTGPFVELLLRHAGGAASLEHHSYGIWTQSVYVDRASRSVVLADSEGYAQVKAPRLVPWSGGGDPVPAVARTVPLGESLFWLGSHVWGRTWNLGDRLSFTWRSTPFVDPVHWEYRVEAIEAPPGHGTARMQMVVTAEGDRHGLSRSWTFHFRDGSPYPESLGLWVDHFPQLEPYLPPQVLDQEIDILQRGEGAIEWPQLSTAVAWPAANLHGTTYRVDERVASPALDEFPLYRVSDALTDLRRLAPEFGPWWDSHPQNMLVRASLVPTYATDGVADAGELTWSLTFTDGHGYHRTWLSSRVFTSDGVVAPTAHRVSGGESDRSMRGEPMRASEYAMTRLSTTAGLSEALRSFDVAGPIDRIEYELWLDHRHGLQGSLLIGHEAGAEEALAGPDHEGGGYALADLRTGMLRQLVWFKGDGV